MNFTLSPVLSRRGLRSLLYRSLLTISLAMLLIVCAGWQHAAQATTLNVPSAQYPTLQSAIDDAHYGDTIILQAGTTFPTPNGPFVLRFKEGGTGTDADYITIKSSALSNLPAGVRVGPGKESSMPKLVTSNYEVGFSYGPPVIITEPYAHHYKLVGLEITAAPSTGLSDKELVALGEGSSAQSSLDQVPDHITLDRCYVHVGPTQPTKRGISLNSKDTSIINSYIAGFKLVDDDSQAIAMWNGPGPYHIINNYLEAATENILVLNSANHIPNLIPSDVEIRNNLFSKPLSWRPGDLNYGNTPWRVKHLLELKTGKRFTVDGNIFEYTWGGSGGDGIAIAILPLENFNPTGSPAQIEDFIFTNNIVLHAAGGIILDGRAGADTHLIRATIKNNLFVDIHGSWGNTYGRLFTVSEYTDQITIEHNTGFNADPAVHSYVGGNTNFIFRNNIVRGNVQAQGVNYPGDVALNANFPSAIWTKNVQIAGGGPDNYNGSYSTPAHLGNYFPATETQVGFVNYAGDDYHLASTSQYKNAGSDGKDIGADIDALNAATGGVRNGLSSYGNVALASNGGVASASSSHDSGLYPASTTINGDRKGTSGWWNDNTQYIYPDWLQVSFNGTKTIDEIDVFTLQNNYQSPSEPTEAMTFSLYGITAFDMQYWSGSAWVTVSNGSVTGNNKVWKKFTFPPITTDKVRVLVNNSLLHHSRIVELEAWGYSPPQTNVALASNGAVASASSVTTGYSPSGAINGDRKGLNWGQNGYWANSGASFPAWMEVAFNGSKTIHEVDVFVIQDSYLAPSEPTETMTFTYYGLTAYQVQYWTGSAWANVPNASVTGNNLVWKKFTFSDLTTSKIRVWVTGSADGYSRIAELEAWGN